MIIEEKPWSAELYFFLFHRKFHFLCSTGKSLPCFLFHTPTIHSGSWDREVLWDSLTLSTGSASHKELPKWQEPLDPTVIKTMISEQHCMPCISLALEIYCQHLQYARPACCCFFNRRSQVLERNKRQGSRVTTAQAEQWLHQPGSSPTAPKWGRQSRELAAGFSSRQSHKSVLWISQGIKTGAAEEKSKDRTKENYAHSMTQEWDSSPELNWSSWSHGQRQWETSWERLVKAIKIYQCQLPAAHPLLI